MCPSDRVKTNTYSCVIFNAVKANFEFIKKLGVNRWCFHDRDIAPDGKTLEVSHSLSLPH